MDVTAIAAAHDRQQRAISKRIAAEAAKAWAQLDPQFLDRSWNDSAGPRILAAVSAGQLLAATSADPYLDQVLPAQGIDPDADGTVEPRSLTGVASDGRDLGSLLYETIITVKSAIAQGSGIIQALTSGLLQLDMIVRTQVADAGRIATSIGTTSRRNAGGFVRMLNPPSCSRCAILAGKWYRWNAGFDRHPRCDCTQIPSSENIAGDLTTDPKVYFHSLSEADQNRLFTAAGAQAIRDGADMNQVVNARRGMYTAGGRSLTSEGTTRRGLYGGYVRQADGSLTVRPGSQLAKTGGRYRTATTPRLMPEQIYKIAGDDRDEAIRLLRSNGFLTSANRPPVAAAARPVTFDDRIAAAAKEHDALAAANAGLGRRTAGMVAVTRKQTNAMRDYVSSYFYSINGQLRRGELDARVTETVSRLDAVMDQAALTKDVVAWRGIADAGRLFGDRLAGDLTGTEWLENAYTSTSALRAVATDFTYQSGQVLMRILVPKGTAALKLSEAMVGGQAELLLQRGLRFRVVADRGVSPQGFRLIDVEVVR